MLRKLMMAGLALGALASCDASNRDQYASGRASMTEAGMPPPPPPPPMSAPAPAMEMSKMAADRDGTAEEQQAGQQPQQDPNQPQQQNPDANARLIAYEYYYGFQVPTGNMEALLNAHKASCETAGAAKCYVVNSSISGLGSESASGQLIIKGSREWVESFKANMADSLKQFGAELDSNNTTSEDLTVQILDTSARLNSAKTLRDRLQALLADRPGRLSDLLEIERELARVQAEIDSTESILAAMRLRVSMSQLTLNYQPKYSAVSESIWRPLGDAFSSFLPNLVASMAAIIEFVSSILLWLVLAAVVIWFFFWRVGRRRKAPRPSVTPEVVAAKTP